MKKVIFGRTHSKLAAESLIDHLLSKVYETLEQKAIFLLVPMHAIEDMHLVEEAVIRINKQQHQRQPSEIKDSDEEPVHERSTQARLLSSEWRVHNGRENNCSLLRAQTHQSLRSIARNIKSDSKTPLQRESRRKKGSNGPKEDSGHYPKFSVQIDMGFTPPGDETEDQIRRKKQEQMNKKMEREEADLKKIMNRKKMDKELMDALIKQKKQVIFTYDYDGLLLPVTKLEPSKIPASQYQMNYCVDSGEQIIPKQPQPYHPPKFRHKKVNKSNLKLPINNNKKDLQHEEEEEEESSPFYRSFERASLVSGVKLKYKGKQIISETPPPNLEFLTKKTKEHYRIQRGDYFEFIKNGNLKRQNLESDRKTSQGKENQNDQNFNESQFMNSSMFKNTRRKNQDSIVVSNAYLLKDLKVMSNLDNLSNTSTYQASGFNFMKKVSKFSCKSPVDIFNQTTIAAINKNTQDSEPSQIQQKNKRESKKIPYGNIHRTSNNKARMRRSNMNSYQRVDLL